jgi:tetratricopeptide (TPR) repeat protein
MLSFDTRHPDNLRQAIRLLDQAVAHDPTFLVAHCALARAHDGLYFFGIDHSPARIALAKEAVDTALRLAPDRGEPHLAAAWIYYHCHRDYERACDELAIAERRLPNDASIFELNGYIARRRGQWERCVSNLERACELDPQNVWLLQQTSQTFYYLRRFSEMAGVLDRALVAAPTEATSRAVRALIDLDSHGDTQPGYDAIHKILNEDPSAVDAIAEHWFYIALCRRDFTEVARALASIPPRGDHPG